MTEQEEYNILKNGPYTPENWSRYLTLHAKLDGMFVCIFCKKEVRGKEIHSIQQNTKGFPLVICKDCKK